MKGELPVGFTMALAQDKAAMERFSAMAEPEKQAVLTRAHEVRSKQEMRQLVSSLTSGCGAD